MVRAIWNPPKLTFGLSWIDQQGIGPPLLSYYVLFLF